MAAVFSVPVLVVGIMAGCSTPMSGMPMTTSTVVSGLSDIEISGFEFTVPASVKTGAQLTIRNTDSVKHSVTADNNGAFDVDVEAGATAVLTVPAAPGPYAFHCEYHP